MKSRSDLPYFLLLFLAAQAAFASDGLFAVLPVGDPTYEKLESLAKVGWITPGEVVPPRTRYEVAQSVIRARESQSHLVVAQAGTDAAPLPSEIGPELRNESATVPEGTPTPQIVSSEEELVKAAESLKSLGEAYKAEVLSLREKVKSLIKPLVDLETDQSGLAKRLRSGGKTPSLAIHGMGRVYGLTGLLSGSPLAWGIPPSRREMAGFLDLEPEAQVTPRLSWRGTIQLSNGFEAEEGAKILFRRMAVSFQPAGMAVTLGDFMESYSPLLMWNRDLLDFAYVPSSWSRLALLTKYEGFQDHEPDWALRGLKVRTQPRDFGWIRGFQASALAHMIKSGIKENETAGWFEGPGVYSDWLFSGTAGFKLKELKLAGKEIKAGLDMTGLLLDEPFKTEQMGAVYDPFAPDTWAHQYRIGSLKPNLNISLGGDWSLGSQLEYAYSLYRDDKRDSARELGDFAAMMGATLQRGEAKFTFHYLSVGPYYYSPLAQTRQDNMSNPFSGFTIRNEGTMGGTRRDVGVLTEISRPGGVFSLYDRTQDAVFPYGLSTPNRQGIGASIDLRPSAGKSWRVKGSAYFVKEIEANLTFNTDNNGYVPVEDPTGTVIPVRKFTYLNLGPSINVGPRLGFKRDIILGANLRMEKTTNPLGDLTSTWFLAEAKAEVVSGWDLSLTGSLRKASGFDWGLYGTSWARAPYLYENTDLGLYYPFHADGQVKSLTVSNVIRLSRQGSLWLDACFHDGDMLPIVTQGFPWKWQTVEMTYEIRF